MKTATCHPEERHYCKGLCKNCYQRMMHKQRAPYLARYAKRGRHFCDPPKCHPDRPHMAHGLCDACYHRRLADAKRARGEKGYSTKWRRENPEKARAAIRSWSLRRKFGITVEEYDAMHAAQNGLCALCNRPERSLKKRLAVDHDHDTGAVRGLLCGPCNVVVGYIENQEWFGKAAAYLARHKQQGAA